MTDIIENKHDLKTCIIKENRHQMAEEKSYFIGNQLSDKTYINEIFKNELNKTSKILQEMVDKLNSSNFERFTQKQLYYINKNVKNFNIVGHFL